MYMCTFASQQAGQSAVFLYIANTAGSTPMSALEKHTVHTEVCPTKHLVLVSQPGVEFHTVYAATCNNSTPVEHGHLPSVQEELGDIGATVGTGYHERSFVVLVPHVRGHASIEGRLEGTEVTVTYCFIELNVLPF